MAFLETPFQVAFKCFYFQKGFQERSKGFILNAYFCTCNSLQRGPINFYTKMFRISHIIEQSALSRQPYYALRDGGLFWPFLCIKDHDNYYRHCYSFLCICLSSKDEKARGRRKAFLMLILVKSAISKPN